MTPLTFEEARACVLATPIAHRPKQESVPLLDALGRVLAEDIPADRDYPAVARSVRDGFAVRAADLPGRLTVLGEVRAGEEWKGPALEAGQAIEIMTGAPMPQGSDAVVMVEHVTRENGGHIQTDRSPAPGENVNPRATEAREGAIVLTRGRRLTFADVALLATVGRESITVNRKPTVAILATGDEVIPLSRRPRSFEVRNSNSYSLAAQVARAGGIPVVLPVAPDRYEETLALIAKGLENDLLLLSGGVSAGKYDIVEKVMADIGARFFFDRVKIQPGQPLVFGEARQKPFFGLPGNPASTMVTFEIFARATLDRLSGVPEPTLPLAWATLTRDFRHKTGLRRFLPAVVANGEVTPVSWTGSSDVPALARANAFLVADPEKGEYAKGEWIQVMFQ